MKKDNFLSNVIIATLAAILSHVEGSGSLYDPPNRAVMWKYGYNTEKNYNYMQLNCGGEKQFENGPYKCGVCGDAPDMAKEHELGGRFGTGMISRYYPAGIKEMPVKVELLAFENGFFEFRICAANNNTVTQECLDENILPIKEGYLEGTPMRFYPKSAGDFRLTVAVPPNLVCERCVLQWRYHTANSWGTNPETKTQGLGEGPQEEFRNCADIRIGGDVPISVLENPFFSSSDVRLPGLPVDRPTEQRKRLQSENSTLLTLSVSPEKIDRFASSSTRRLNGAAAVKTTADTEGSDHQQSTVRSRFQIPALRNNGQEAMSTSSLLHTEVNAITEHTIQPGVVFGSSLGSNTRITDTAASGRFRAGKHTANLEMSSGVSHGDISLSTNDINGNFPRDNVLHDGQAIENIQFASHSIKKGGGGSTVPKSTAVASDRQNVGQGSAVNAATIAGMNFGVINGEGTLMQPRSGKSGIGVPVHISNTERSLFLANDLNNVVNGTIDVLNTSVLKDRGSIKDSVNPVGVQEDIMTATEAGISLDNKTAMDMMRPSNAVGNIFSLNESRSIATDTKQLKGTLFNRQQDPLFAISTKQPSTGRQRILLLRATRPSKASIPSSLEKGSNNMMVLESNQPVTRVTKNPSLSTTGNSALTISGLPGTLNTRSAKGSSAKSGISNTVSMPDISINTIDLKAGDITTAEVIDPDKTQTRTMNEIDAFRDELVKGSLQQGDAILTKEKTSSESTKTSVENVSTGIDSTVKALLNEAQQMLSSTFEITNQNPAASEVQSTLNTGINLDLSSIMGAVQIPNEIGSNTGIEKNLQEMSKNIAHSSGTQNQILNQPVETKTLPISDKPTPIASVLKQNLTPKIIIPRLDIHKTPTGTLKRLVDESFTNQDISLAPAVTNVVGVQSGVVDVSGGNTQNIRNSVASGGGMFSSDLTRSSGNSNIQVESQSSSFDITSHPMSNINDVRQTSTESVSLNPVTGTGLIDSSSPDQTGIIMSNERQPFPGIDSKSTSFDLNEIRSGATSSDVAFPNIQLPTESLIQDNTRESRMRTDQFRLLNSGDAQSVEPVEGSESRFTAGGTIDSASGFGVASGTTNSGNLFFDRSRDMFGTRGQDISGIIGTDNQPLDLGAAFFGSKITGTSSAVSQDSNTAFGSQNAGNSESIMSMNTPIDSGPMSNTLDSARRTTLTGDLTLGGKVLDFSSRGATSGSIFDVTESQNQAVFGQQRPTHLFDGVERGQQTIYPNRIVDLSDVTSSPTAQNSQTVVSGARGSGLAATEASRSRVIGGNNIIETSSGAIAPQDNAGDSVNIEQQINSFNFNSIPNTDVIGPGLHMTGDGALTTGFGPRDGTRMSLSDGNMFGDVPTDNGGRRVMSREDRRRGLIRGDSVSGSFDRRDGGFRISVDPRTGREQVLPDGMRSTESIADSLGDARGRRIIDRASVLRGNGQVDSSARGPEYFIDMSGGESLASEDTSSRNDMGAVSDRGRQTGDRMSIDFGFDGSLRERSTSGLDMGAAFTGGEFSMDPIVDASSVLEPVDRSRVTEPAVRGTSRDFRTDLRGRSEIDFRREGGDGVGGGRREGLDTRGEGFRRDGRRTPSRRRDGSSFSDLRGATFPSASPMIGGSLTGGPFGPGAGSFGGPIGGFGPGGFSPGGFGPGGIGSGGFGPGGFGSGGFGPGVFGSGGFSPGGFGSGGFGPGGFGSGGLGGPGMGMGGPSFPGFGPGFM